MTALVIDDDDDVRTWLRTMLELEGWEVADARDGPSGLEAAAHQTPDLIVIDQMMPGMLGTEAARRMRDTGYAGSILLFTAFLDEQIRQQAELLDLVPISKVDSEALMRQISVIARQLR